MCVVTRTCLGASGAPSSSSNIVTVGEAILRNLRSKGIRAIGLLSWALVLVGGFALLFVVFNFQETADFFTENVSPDGHIQNYLRLYVVSFTLPVYLIVFGLVLWQLLRIGYFSGGQAIFSFRHRPLNPNPGLTVVFFALGALLVIQYLVGCVLHTPISQALCYPYRREGLYEIVTFLTFLVGSFVLAILARRARQIAMHHHEAGFRLSAAVLGLAALGCFLIAMEEISWGQTFFGWNTPASIKEINLQNETNIHNIFNDYFPAYNSGGAAFVFLGTFATIWLRFGRRVKNYVVILFPNPNLVGLAAWFPLASPIKGELLEILAAVFLLIYCWSLSTAFRELDQHMGT